MPNGSVASRLKVPIFDIFIADTIQGKPVLDWPRRKNTALGTARGLLYLHEQCDPKIIHRDVKAANILLDEDFEAVGDFRLAKLLDHRDSYVTTAVRGTVGPWATLPRSICQRANHRKKTIYLVLGSCFLN
ncbi:putative protein kinase RLK-Pelle-LRR-II family [Helianthus anomalus]